MSAPDDRLFKRLCYSMILVLLFAIGWVMTSVLPTPMSQAMALLWGACVGVVGAYVWEQHGRRAPDQPLPQPAPPRPVPRTRPIAPLPPAPSSTPEAPPAADTSELLLDPAPTPDPDHLLVFAEPEATHRVACEDVIEAITQETDAEATHRVVSEEDVAETTQRVVDEEPSTMPMSADAIAEAIERKQRQATQRIDTLPSLLADDERSGEATQRVQDPEDAWVDPELTPLI